MKTTLKTIIILVIGLVAGGVATYFADRNFIIEGKNTQIASLQQQRDLYQSQKDELIKEKEKLESHINEQNPNDPSRQLLTTARALIEITVDENNIKDEANFEIGVVRLSFENKQGIFLRMYSDHAIEGSTENKKLGYDATLDIEDYRDKAIGKPISQILNVSCIQGYIQDLKNRKILNGTITFDFNGYLCDVNIPSQIAKDSNFAICPPQFIRKGY